VDTDTVYDVVVRTPKTLGPRASVGQARVALGADHVPMLLITDGDGRLLGTLVRDDLPPSAEESSLALDHAVLIGRTLAPETSAEQARQLLLAHGERRRAVVDDEGRLLGLLCLKRRLTGFCSDEDVRSRAQDLAR
jgi:CBS domain-containing protein